MTRRPWLFGADKQLVLNALEIDTETSQLDLNDNSLILKYSGDSPLDDITGYLTQAYQPIGATHWQGNGLTSGAAAFDSTGATTLGITDDGEGTILVRYTAHGSPPFE